MADQLRRRKKGSTESKINSKGTLKHGSCGFPDPFGLWAVTTSAYLDKKHRIVDERDIV
jgi:hypothetical protein